MSHFTTNAPSPWEEPLRKAMHAHADGDLVQAAARYRCILNDYPFLSRVAYNLGNIHKEFGDYDEAELLYRQAVGAEPELFEAAQNLAFVVQEQGRIDEAVVLYREILHRWPGLPDPLFSLACLQLLTGNLGDGWKGYEARFDCLVNPVTRRHTEIPFWDGVLSRGLRLLVHTEQGYGDAIQMSRYLPMLTDAGIHVTLETDAALKPLLFRIPGLTTCLTRGEALPAVNAQTPLMSLPGLFGTTLATIPAPALPLPEEVLVRQMAELLPEGNGLRVGLCWSGRLDVSANRKRSCPPELIRSLLEIPGCSFVSLQTNAPPEHCLADPRLIDRTDRLGSFHDTAALIANLDLVITIDTAVAHLAGSMGKPTWLLLPFVPDWRWLLGRDDSPWYPSMRLFRQPTRGVWEPVIDQIRLELARYSPCPGEALTNLGATLGMAGRHEEALEIYREAIEVAPAIAVTHYNRGNSLATLGRADEAQEAWKHCLTLDPGLVEAWHNLAISHRDRGNLDEAHGLVRHALQLRPDDADLHHTMGELLQAGERFTDAIDSFRHALELGPDSARTWNSLGVVYQHLEDDRSAEECYRHALDADPWHLHARNNLGAVLLTLGQPGDSVRELETLLQMAPEYQDGHWNLACSLLAAGEWQRGWQEFEARFRKHSPVEQSHPEIPRWAGEPLEGKTILLTGEQAFGDTIQFARFAPLLAVRGARVILECQAPPLKRLMKSIDVISAVICRGEPLPTVDYRLPLMSLPLILGTPPEEVAAAVPYLKPERARLDHWRSLVAERSGLRIGLCWWGRQTIRNRRRSCTPDLLLPLATVPGVTLYRLQVGDEAPIPPFPLEDHTGLIHDFADTAALISCLDLVITIDTAVAHLAGGLGIPVWLMLPPTGDWRWMTGREDSPWYPTMRIFRQPEGGGWQPVIAAMVEALKPLAAPTLYIYRQGTDFAETEHLANHLVPLLDTPDTLSTSVPAVMAPSAGQADLLLFPYFLENLTEWVTIEGMWRFLESLPLFADREAAHILFSDHDAPVPYHSSAWWFRASITPTDRDRHSVPLPYRTEDLCEHLHFDLSQLKYHASFVGYLGLRRQRARLLESFTRTPHLHVLIEPTEAFHGHQSPEKRAERRQRFLDLSSSSLCIICPSGDGTNSIRFYEALSLGRLPVLLSDCPLPFEKEIPYHRFVCRISPADADRAGELLRDWITSLGTEDVVERCREARRAWEEWFSPAALPARLWTELLRARCRSLAPPPPALARRPAGPETAPVEEALERIKNSPRSARSYLLLGCQYADHSRNTDAENAFLRAIGYDHRCFDAYLQLGRLLASTGRDHEAVERFYEASLVSPDNPAPYREALPCLERLGRGQEADHCRQRLAAFDTAEPDVDTETLMAEGDALREQERWQEAFDRYSCICGREPGHRLAQLRAGGCLVFLNRHREAREYLHRAIYLQPDDPDPHINLAICHLAEGNWPDGWGEFEWRRRYITDPLPPLPELLPLEEGERLDGKSVLVHCEQGFGDMLQFSRFLPLLTECGATVALSAPRELVRLFRSLGEGITVVAHGELLPQTDFQTLLLSLPGLLSKIQPLPPDRTPYLSPSPELIADWQQRTAELPGLRVGIAWQGRNMGKSGYRRSLDLQTLTPLLTLVGCSFVSLHPQPLELPHPAIMDFSAYITDFADTAALMAGLDLVITVDTAVAHLAGALGVPCWTALLHAPDWRWFPLESDDSVWYPEMRLFRQEPPDDWDGVVARIVASLREELLTRRGHDLMAQGLEAEAVDCFRTATGHRDATASSWLNLGTALHRTGATAEGREALKHAVRISPSYPEAWQNLGLLHQALGEISDAFICFQKALRLRSDYPTARWNLSLLQLLIGDYEEGFRNYEARFEKSPPVPRRHAGLPLWDGGPLEGKRIVVHAEQGYGDTIQFCRYLPFLTEAGASVIFEVQDQRLCSLIRTLPCHCTVIARGEEVPTADLQVPLMSLPRVFRTSPDTVPAAIPYLQADVEQIERWHARMVRGRNLKVGIAWKGSREHVNDRFRSCPPEALAPLGLLTDIDWYSLQVDGSSVKQPSLGLIDLTAHIADFGDTAALVSTLDLVVSVDTSVAHLAGALGRETWLLLPFDPDWRWGLDRTDTPWYPGMRLLRQDKAGDWPGVIQQVIRALSKLAD